jgi:hypothetical protein
MGIMPFHVEVGPNWEVLEDYCNGSRQRLVDALAKLEAGGDLMDIGLFTSKTLVGGPLSLQQLRDHGRRDWFGMRETANGQWQPQPPFNKATNPTTGYWRQWYGDAEEIVRTTLRHAARLSLGLADGADPDDARHGTQHWPIRVLIKCTQPWFEGWIRWSRDPGLVIVIFAVPGNGHPLLTTPMSPPARNNPDYAVGPGCQGDEGLWVITHTTETPHTVETSAPSSSGHWIYPIWGSVYEGTGPIVTVAPAEIDGGVLAAGRHFVP